MDDEKQRRIVVVELGLSNRSSGCESEVGAGAEKVAQGRRNAPGLAIGGIQR